MLVRFLIRHLFFRLPWYILFSMQIELFCGLQTTHIFLVATTGRKSTERSLELLPCGALSDRCAAYWTTNAYAWISVVPWSSVPSQLADYCNVYRFWRMFIYQAWFFYIPLGGCVCAMTVCADVEKKNSGKKVLFFLVLSAWHKIM